MGISVPNEGQNIQGGLTQRMVVVDLREAAIVTPAVLDSSFVHRQVTSRRASWTFKPQEEAIRPSRYQYHPSEHSVCNATYLQAAVVQCHVLYVEDDAVENH